MSTDLQQREFHTESELIDWAVQYVPVQQLELVSDHPWARTYRTHIAGTHYYLKDVPPGQTAALPAAKLLSDAFPETIPAVVACTPDEGLLMSVDHGGKNLGRRPSSSQRRTILGTYASLQSRATTNAELISALPKFELSTVLDEFLGFLSGDQEVINRIGLVGASHFLGEDDAIEYSRIFEARSVLLSELLLQAEKLPTTLNHCDLRPQNTAITDDGRCVIFDWDEAVAGPAGLSLHSSFSGCFMPARLMLSPHEPTEDRKIVDASRLLREYVSTLSDCGYSDPATLLQSLPGSITAGVMHYLMSYAKYPCETESDRDQVAEIIERRLNDLIDLCDLLAAQSRELTLKFLNDYEQHQAFGQAEHLLESYLRESPGDAEMQIRLAATILEDGRTREAESFLRSVLEQDPENAAGRELLAKVLLDNLQLSESVEQFREALERTPHSLTIKEKLSEAVELLEIQDHAARPGCVPTIRFSENEIEQLRMSRKKRKLSARLFRKYGCLLIENAFSPHLLDQMAGQFIESHQEYLQDKRHESALRVGDKRFMITVAIEGAFNSPDVYYPPMVMPIIKRILGEDMILSSFTSVTSLPDSDDMKMHKDHPALFDASEMSEQLPNFAVTMLVPLLGISEELGTTRVVKGSHKFSSKESYDMEHQDPFGPQGSCLLMDYRLSHQGMANRSERVRPVMSLVYSRPWFRDHVNYNKQPPLVLSASEHERVPDERKSLFRWLRVSENRNA